ncbi:hypothetical protein [Nonomuraea terrae]|uniref:hypothetical protein n=1 Tax=Nonomuraea terrae TaxID=2530383 RepID=UPI00140484FA|nr:hypothetical protein [Nonomuraea terrae]
MLVSSGDLDLYTGSAAERIVDVAFLRGAGQDQWTLTTPSFAVSARTTADRVRRSS